MTHQATTGPNYTESVKTEPTPQDENPKVGQVLRQARTHYGLSLREVERKIGRSNAYLSQIERGVIKQPDPIVLYELSELYGLNFQLIARWASWAREESDSTNSDARDLTGFLFRQVMELDDSDRARILEQVESMLRSRRT